MLNKLVILLFITGCSVAAVKPYRPNYKNSQLLVKSNLSIRNVNVFTNNFNLRSDLSKNSLTCRLSEFDMPTGQDVKSFIIHAIETEFDAASKLSKDGIPLNVEVFQLESDTSGISEGKWKLNFSYEYEKEEIRIQTVYRFTSAFTAGVACLNTADALENAIAQNFHDFLQTVIGNQKKLNPSVTKKKKSLKEEILGGQEVIPKLEENVEGDVTKIEN